MSTTGPVSGVTPVVGASPLTPVAAPMLIDAQLAAQLAASAPLLDVATADPTQAAARAVAAAKESAAERQGAMAPLLADLSTALDAPSTPPQVKAAIAQVLALQTPAKPTLDGPTLQRAVAQSGLMLEAHIATAAQAPAAQAGTGGRSSPNLSPGGPPSGRPPASPPTDLKAALLTLQGLLKSLPEVAASVPARVVQPTPPEQDAATPPPPQSPPAPALNTVYTEGSATPPVDDASISLTPGVERALDAAAVPPPVRTAVAQVLQSSAGSPPPAPAAMPDAQSLRQAVAQLGQLLAARSAAPPASKLEPSPAGQPLAAEPTADDLKAAMTLLQSLVKTPAAAAGRRGAPPPPPTRDGDLAAQAVSPALDAEPDAALQRLPAEVDQALARQTLHQLASTPDGRQPTWMFELPLLTPQGQTVAQFAVSRDGGRRDADDDDDKGAWRARFALDIAPLGKIHVHLRMDGDRSSAVLWAEHDQTLQQLRASGGVLAGALGGEVAVHPGAPRPAPPAAPGQFVDQKS